MKLSLVDTTPVDMRNQGTVNLGLNIVANKTKANVIHYTQKDLPKSDIFGFNVFYPMNLLNAFYFINKHKLKSGEVLFGGQGVSNLKDGLLKDVGDVWLGEYDGNRKDADGWYRADHIVSNPQTSRSRNGLIELTRGCKYSCSFCEYGNIGGGVYREKDIDLVLRQIDYMVVNRIRNINFMSANFAGYSKLDELMEYALSKGIRVLNTDFCLMDIPKICKWAKKARLSTVKIGIESFNESTRVSIGKGVPDDRLQTIIEQLLSFASNIHFYLIYGLPDDDYARWGDWVKRLSGYRRHYTYSLPTLFGDTVTKNSKDIRFEFSLTNFEPCRRTPLEFALPVDFNAKDAFLCGWLDVLVREGFYRPKGQITYSTARGRIGRKEKSYKLLMALKNGGGELLPMLLSSQNKGVKRSVLDKNVDALMGSDGI